jgi:hypothetical protein
VKTIIWVTRASDERLIGALAKGRKRARAPYVSRSWGGRYRVAAKCWEACGKRALRWSMWCLACLPKAESWGKVLTCGMCGFDYFHDWDKQFSPCGHLGSTNDGMTGVGDCNEGADEWAIDDLRKALTPAACRDLARLCREDRKWGYAAWNGWPDPPDGYEELSERLDRLHRPDDYGEQKLVIVVTACAAPDDVFERIMRLLEVP